MTDFTIPVLHGTWTTTGGPPGFVDVAGDRPSAPRTKGWSVSGYTTISGLGGGHSVTVRLTRVDLSDVTPPQVLWENTFERVDDSYPDRMSWLIPATPFPGDRSWIFSVGTVQKIASETPEPVEAVTVDFDLFERLDFLEVVAYETTQLTAANPTIVLATSEERHLAQEILGTFRQDDGGYVQVEVQVQFEGEWYSASEGKAEAGSMEGFNTMVPVGAGAAWQIVAIATFDQNTTIDLDCEVYTA